MGLVVGPLWVLTGGCCGSCCGSVVGPNGGPLWVPAERCPWSINPRTAGIRDASRDFPLTCSDYLVFLDVFLDSGKGQLLATACEAGCP